VFTAWKPDMSRAVLARRPVVVVWLDRPSGGGQVETDALAVGCQKGVGRTFCRHQGRGGQMLGLKWIRMDHTGYLWKM